MRDRERIVDHEALTMGGGECETGRDEDVANKLSIIILLICSSGKILNDDTALKEYKIDEKNFVVVMVAKVSNESL